jgi:ribosome-binding protein aMBF1 (putative translation factor)
MPTLQEARQTKGWSRDDLAAESGVPVEVIVALETGHSQQPTAEHTRALARVLGMDASTVYELRPGLGLSAIGETGSGEDAKTGAGEP